MAGSHAIRGRWSYRGEEATSSSYSVSSSSSTPGTLSTAYTSSGSYMSSGYLASAMHFDLLERAKAAKEDQIQHVESLVREFFAGRGGVRVPERWLTELGTGWVLHLPLTHDPESAERELDQTCYNAPSWIRALAQIVEIMRSTTWLVPVDYCEEEPDTGRAPEPDRGSVTQLPNSEDEEQTTDVPDQLQFAKFFQQVMLKMLPFVDCIVSRVLVASNGIKMEQPYKKLSTLLGVHGALSKALPQIQLVSSSLPSAQVSRIQCNVVSLLEAKQVKAGGAIWSIMEEIRARILLELMEDNGDDSSGTTVTLEGSSDIHKATRSVISYIGLLQANYSSLAPLVSVNYESHNAAVPPLDSMIIEIGSCLEEKLAKTSESFPDHSLRFLFLLNNSYSISQEVDPIWFVMEFDHVAANSESFLSFTEAHQQAATRKVWSYMESYLQASWAPVLSCLFSNPPPLCFGKNKKYSPLAMFESEFQKIYATQKLWKVPDPGLRKSLRKAITMKIMPDYTKYIEDNNITTPRIAPHELEEMLQELFEG